MAKNKVLLVLDGWGEAPQNPHNAIAIANTPNYDYLIQHYPHSLLEASGQAVGLPTGQMGNSEVGHITIGAGRVIFQDLPRISKAIERNELASHPLLTKLVDTLQVNQRVCHVMGLISDGGVHAHIEHIIAICKFLEQRSVKYVLHAFTDGRDTAPQSAIDYLIQLKNAGITPHSICGRFYAMDRDKRWDRTEKAYNAIMQAQGATFQDAIEAIKQSYANSITDEFILPHIHQEYRGVENDDAIIMCNFRADRVRQLLEAIVDDNFEPFAREKIKLSAILGMVPYSAAIDSKIAILFPKQHVTNTLGEIIANHQLRQLRIAETEKYAHVTFFFNGGRESVFVNEDRKMIASPKVATYDLAPAMSVEELGDKLCEAITSKRYDFICANIANADMVGHSGNLQATVEAIEAIDKVLGKIIKALEQANAEMLITADHGNAEVMVDSKTSAPLTSHTLSKVPLIYYGKGAFKLQNGELQDIAPTILKLLDITVPIEIQGKNLLIEE